jgi:hypothetical protein
MTVVKCVDALARLFPSDELTLYRLYAKDPNFHSLCDDWLEAAEACKRWQAADGSNAEKGAEYRLLASEIETEILKRLREGSP